MGINKFLQSSNAIQSVSKKDIVLKTIQTEEYDVHKIQQNMKESLSATTQLLKTKIATVAKINAVLTAQVTTDKTTLIFPVVESDSTKSYNSAIGTYNAPQAGVFMCGVHANITVTAGAPTYFTVFLTSEKGREISSRFPVASSFCSIDFSTALLLSNAEAVSFRISANSGGNNVSIATDALMFFNLVG